MWHKDPQIVARCNCRHDFQDKKYGKGMRVMNPRKPKGTEKAYRCTVCRAEHQQ